MTEPHPLHVRYRVTYPQGEAEYEGHLYIDHGVLIFERFDRGDGTIGQLVFAVAPGGWKLVERIPLMKQHSAL